GVEARRGGGRGAVGDVGDVDGGGPSQIVGGRAVTHETAGLHIPLAPEHPRQPVLQRKLGQACGLRVGERRRHGNKAADGFSCHRHERAPSNSSTVAAGTMWSWTASFPRAASNSLTRGGREGVVGFQRTPIFVACGTACFSNSSSLAARSVRMVDSPVAFPPGRARLATCPMPTGSAWA